MKAQSTAHLRKRKRTAHSDLNCEYQDERIEGGDLFGILRDERLRIKLGSNADCARVELFGAPVSAGNDPGGEQLRRMRKDRFRLRERLWLGRPVLRAAEARR